MVSDVVRVIYLHEGRTNLVNVWCQKQKKTLLDRINARCLLYFFVREKVQKAE